MNSLVWFNNNLRINDNHSLSKACRASEKTIAVFCFDPRQFQIGEFGFKKTERYRAKFLIESVKNLKQNLSELNITLFVFFKRPETIIPKLIDEHHIHTVYLQAEWTRYENKILSQTKSRTNSSVRFIESYDQLLYHPEDVPFENFEAIPDVFTFFRKKIEKLATVKPLLKKSLAKPVDNLISEQTKLPSLKDLGFEELETDKRSAFPFQGGESKALERLQDYFWGTQYLSSYKKTRNGLVGTYYSSKFSPWLANGCISPRTIYWQVKEYEQQIVKNHDTYWLIFELIWRDYFKYISLKYGVKIFKLGGILDREYEWKQDKKTLNNWIHGETHEPFINANMNELAATGWMSNRGRQNVASFWAKELEQDWRIGAAYFESMLIDYDVHSNWCNWMYLSGVGNDPRDRKFNIQRQASVYDPKNEYQDLWLK